MNDHVRLAELQARFDALAEYVQQIETLRDPAMVAFDYEEFKRLRALRIVARLRQTGAEESAEWHAARELFYAGVRAGRAAMAAEAPRGSWESVRSLWLEAGLHLDD